MKKKYLVVFLLSMISGALFIWHGQISVVRHCMLGSTVIKTWYRASV